MECLFIFLSVFVGALSIMGAVHSFQRGNYFFFGLGLMWAFTDAVMIIALINRLFL